MPGSSPGMTAEIAVTMANQSPDIEEGLSFAPQFGADGLVTAVVTDAKSGAVLMVAHMNKDALAKTIETGEAWYYSRSRKALWKKGETSGHIQRVIEMRVDCDQDAIWIRVEQTGGACPTGRHSCFYRKLSAAEGGARLAFVDADKVFDPATVYSKNP